MRGTVLLLATQDSRGLYAECFRANDVRVHEAASRDSALEHLDSSVPDAIVFIVDDVADGASFVDELRGLVDEGTSILVVSADVSPHTREQFRTAGADALLPTSTPPTDVLYEIRRALILRRSGRRLPWNWLEQTRPIWARW